ncbi:MAG: hypothetical protein IKH95_01960 [Bacteroidaceae bacterium]|jgi:hypothetical protein|nr:hypothetical protein [Bacteroidaceae bacterium]
MENVLFYTVIFIIFVLSVIKLGWVLPVSMLFCGLICILGLQQCRTSLQETLWIIACFLDCTLVNIILY